ncbi:MAG TPA: patatin-like protein [Pyrinomonadaceae bacterium]|nr:patatin-like protein [Pyrinomonadaceae bacterium]
MINPSSPQTDYTKEVRFAVVMYGGVSLAIYINGVAQELYRMVRSTAEAGEGADGKPAQLSSASGVEPKRALKGTERVYRKLSHLLSDDSRRLKECQEKGKSYVEDEPATWAPLVGELEALLEESNKSVTTKFVVDILSGTSAGGINAIYLAKAFANNQPIDQLKDLWVNEGDIALLLNDKQSVMGLHLKNQSPPQSLLNSRRMYLKLLKSLEDMEKARPSKKEFNSPYVDELDLFITATDIEGVPVPLRLSDAVVYERRHRNVFHFKYAKHEVVGRHFNDFTGELNPFLAFAARCTSSFPFAFEPMRLCDAKEVLELFGKPTGDETTEELQRYFQEELDPNTGSPIRPPRFSRRSFGDGGYLDNKPFSYATETLANRQSDVPVDRKLIYIEPSPEHPEDERSDLQKPNALQNVKAALLDLPTYETIREDLQRVLDRNQLIERVNRIISGIERDVNRYIPEAIRSHFQNRTETEYLGPASPVFSMRAMGTGSSEQSASRSIAGTGTGTGGEYETIERNTAHDPPSWAKLDLADMVNANSRYFLPYRRLRISAVTDEIARLVARLANFDEKSDQFLAIRSLVRLWREENYVDYTEEGKETVNRFLWSYDYGYRQRRLSFSRAKVDQLSKFDDELVKELQKFASGLKQLRKEQGDFEQDEEILRKFPQIRLQQYGERLLLLKDQQLQLQPVLIFIKSELNEIFKNLRTSGRWLRSRETQKSKEKMRSARGKQAIEAAPNPLLHLVAQIGITPQDLTEILGMSPESGANCTSRSITVESELNEDDHVERARVLLQRDGTKRIWNNLKATADELRNQLEIAFEVTRRQTSALLNPYAEYEPISPRGKEIIAANPPLLSSEIAEISRGFLSYYYNQFDDYDQIRFPIMYETDYGEADVVEVIRISPEDAVSLIDERKEARDKGPGKARLKLAGISLHHFGAFLDRTWRQNDIMWGRLDGVERLIAGLLPGTVNKPIRTELIKEAQLEILKEELKPEGIRELQGVLSDALLRASGGSANIEAVKEAMDPLEKAAVKTRLEEIMRSTVKDKELLGFVGKGYEVNRQLDPKLMLRSMSRSTQIIGKIFEDLANESGFEGKRLAWIARLGQIFWGLVEVAVPSGILNLLVMHWLKLLYVFEVLLLVTSIILTSPEIQSFAWKALILTVLANVAILLLRDVMRLRHRWQHVFLSVAVLMVLVVAGVGTHTLVSLGFSGILARIIEFANSIWTFLTNL